MPAYVILTREKTRIPRELDVYDKLAPASFASYPVKLLVRHGRHEVLEGPDTEDVMLVEFPSFDAAKAWHESNAYQAIAEHRFKGGDFRCIVMEGV
jgi:uncharacterized protein (DUF1330 family)